MSEANIGFRVRMNIERPSLELVQKFKGWSTGNISDANGRGGAMDYRIKPLESTMRFVGTAITVKARPIDNLIIYKAMQIAKPGDVLVISNDNSTSSSVFGDHVAAIAKALGIVAFVTDGLARDAAGLREVGLPVFFRGINPNGPHKDGPGEINFPISCGGLPVNPGDVLVGDEDGVVVIPKEDLPSVVNNLDIIGKKEKQMSDDFANGKLIPGWVNEVMTAKKVQIV